MKAVVKTGSGAGHVAYQDWPNPQPGRDDVLVAVKRAGICGTDVALYEWNQTAAIHYAPQLPIVMGHEFAGEVVEVGQGVCDLQVGDQVIVNPLLTCGTCRFCKAKRTMLCPSRRTMGLNIHGVFAEYAVVPASNVYRLADRMPWDLAAVAEPFAVAVHALERVPVEPDSIVAIIGPGSIGFCMLAALRLAGATHVVMVGVEADRERLALASAMGATAVCIGREDPKKAVLQLSDGFGADVSFEAAGHPEAFSLALRLTGKAGRVGLIGLPHEPVQVDCAGLALAEQELIGIRAHGPSTWQRLPDLLERASDDLASIVTHRVPLSEFERGVQLVRSREGLKVLLTVGD